MEKPKFRMPTAYTILFLLIILVAAATWLIPSGAFIGYDNFFAVYISNCTINFRQNTYAAVISDSMFDTCCNDRSFCFD